MRKLGTRAVQGLLRPIAFRNIVAGSHDCDRSPSLVPFQGPAAGHRNLGAVPLGMNEISFPASGANELRLDLFQGRRKHGFQQLMKNLADRFIDTPSEELLSGAVPIDVDVVHIAY